MLQCKTTLLQKGNIGKGEGGDQKCKKANLQGLGATLHVVGGNCLSRYWCDHPNGFSVVPLVLRKS